ncbi:hypothetical protein P4601_21245, partial [Peribacillus frigoritolerans]|uniref:hypothetical protein n=1 Tax=Peribacillus frigoritolerans TaxID=450367 RepID=UPI002E2302F0|nr:hypothetical protein [Peribacillus frigoritolerans]
MIHAGKDFISSWFGYNCGQQHFFLFLFGCFSILCCYLPSNVEWLIFPPDARFPRQTLNSFVLKTTIFT